MFTLPTAKLRIKKMGENSEANFSNYQAHALSARPTCFKAAALILGRLRYKAFRSDVSVIIQTTIRTRIFFS